MREAQQLITQTNGVIKAKNGGNQA